MIYAISFCSTIFEVIFRSIAGSSSFSTSKLTTGVLLGKFSISFSSLAIIQSIEESLIICSIRLIGNFLSIGTYTAPNFQIASIELINSKLLSKYTPTLLCLFNSILFCNKYARKLECLSS